LSELLLPLTKSGILGSFELQSALSPVLTLQKLSAHFDQNLANERELRHLPALSVAQAWKASGLTFQRWSKRIAAIMWISKEKLDRRR
jgi:hypothetical protein